MAKLPDAGDLGNPNFRTARSFSNVPVADYQGAFGALGRGLSDIGEGAQRYAIAVDKRVKDEEAFGVNLRLADAQVQFSNTVSGLDPSDPEFAQKRMKAWSDTFKPIMDGIRHGENKRRFGEWAYENGSKIQIESNRLALEANTGKTKLQIVQYMEAQKKLVADGVISPEVASANIKSQIAQAPYLFELDKQEILLKDATKFDADIIEMTAFNVASVGSESPIIRAQKSVESSNDPNAISPKGALGVMQVMPETAPEIAQELGDQEFFKLNEEERKKYLLREDVSTRYGTHYMNKMLKRYDGDLELALIAYNAGAKRADMYVAAGRDYETVKKKNPKDSGWISETKPYVEKVFAKLNADGGAPQTVRRRGQSEASMISALEANPVFRGLPVDQQNGVRERLRERYRQELEEQEKLDMVSGTRAIVDELITKYPEAPDRQKAEEELRSRVQDPLALEDGIDMLNEGYTRAAQAKEAAKVELRKATTAKVLELRNAGKTDEAIAAAKVDGLDPEDVEALRELALKGPATTDNAQIEGDLWALSYKNPKAFSEIDLSLPKYRNGLTQETLEKFQSIQQKALKPEEKTNLRTAGAMLDNYYAELGLKDSNKKDAQLKKIVDIQVGRAISSLETKANRKATQEEIQSILDDTFLTYTRPGGFWDGYQTQTYKLPDVLQMFRDEADEQYSTETLYDLAIQSIEKNGYPVTPENLSRWLDSHREAKNRTPQ